MSEEEVNYSDHGGSSISSVENLQNPKKRIRSKKVSSKPGKIVKRSLSLFAKESNQPRWLISKVPRVRDKKGKFRKSRRNAKTNKNINKEQLHLDDIEADNGSSVAVSILVFILLFACLRLIFLHAWIIISSAL